MPYRRFLMIGLISLSIMNVAALRAHELFFDDTAGEPVLMRGHDRPESDHGVETVPVSPIEISQRRLFDPEGGSLEAGEPLGRILIRLHECPWTQTATGAVNRPRDEVDAPLGAWISIESIDYLARWTETIFADDEPGLVVAPRVDPFSLGVGRKLRLRISLDGRPASGAVVTCNGRPRGVTGPDGLMNIKLRRPGRQLIGATLRRLPESTDGIETIRTTFLQFELEK